MKNIVDFSALQIKLTSPEKIKTWSHGEVTKPETINYRTLKPEKDGLFSETIFGPTKDWECYCGKYKRIRFRGIICDKCGVEVTQSRVRRERKAHIGLASPVAHVWFFKGAPSKLSLLLGIVPRALEAVVYFARYLVIEVDSAKKKEAQVKLDKLLADKKKELKEETRKVIGAAEKEAEKEKKEAKKKITRPDQQALASEEIGLKTKQKIQGLRDEQVIETERAEEVFATLTTLVKSLKEKSTLSEDEYLKLEDYGVSGFFRAGMGAEAVLEVIKKIDINLLVAQLREEVHQSRGQRHIKATKRLRVVEGMKKASIDPAWMILQLLPVLPPDLRPMVQLSGGRFATSDLNDLYRRVINRNNRLKHLINLGAPEIILRNEKRMLQEAVDSLIDSSQYLARRRRRLPKLRSLSDMLRGKQGRFRQNLLGKRVDYSGRSVIVVGPELKLNQCGLPKEMVLEMFKPYVLRQLILQGLAPNVKSAKNVLEHRPPEVFDILEEITKNHPVLLNRAPTLHKLGIQAFYPVIIEGNAISIHPCVCAGYNADFDGDQMAVHVPLSAQAQEEAKTLMMPEQNLLKPADGSPITVPNKEMALGCYYLTSINQEIAEEQKTIFASPEETILAHQEGKIGLRQLINVRMGGKPVKTTAGRLIFNRALPPELGFVNDAARARTITALITRALQVCARERVTRLIDDLKDLGFDYATSSGISVAVSDNEIFPQKEEMIAEANRRVAEIEANFRQGLITEQERRRLTQDVWIDTTEEVAEATWENFGPENSVRLVIDSGGTRASRDQVKQLAAMRGLVVDPLGKIVELPTKSNFREGLSIFEYVTSTRGSRKGLTDSALKTADAGYLTRRLVDVAHDVIIRIDDCQTKEGLEIGRAGEREKSFLTSVLGRIVAADVVKPGTRKVLVKKGEVITETNIGLLEKNNLEKVSVRSPLSCQARYGICAACYGWDFSTRRMVELGTPVGVVAAQSIGEPGTQLTMRVKHTGGIIARDVTQGLPRVEELFEARTPKALAPLAEISGKVEVSEMGEGFRVRIRTIGKPVELKEYLIPLTSRLLVKDGQLVSAGERLASGALDVREVLEIRGLRAAQIYLVNAVQVVYESQGIPIHDKHFEIIVRKMSEKVKVETAGDTELLPGELVDKVRFEEENKRVLAEGGEPAVAQVVVLGITRSSLYTESWLSAASFQETTNVLTDAAIAGKVDRLLGLKENVIIGRLIPTTPERSKIEA